MSRTVTLALVDSAGTPLGALPSFGVPEPWWQEVGSIVDGARRRYGVEVSVLRLLTADRAAPPGGCVSYLAEVGAPPRVPLAPVTVDLAPQPRRAPWAQPGGPARSLAWAKRELDRLGRPVTGVNQQRSWNLSAIWRLDGPQGSAWLKQVPAFFRHEAAVLRWLATATPDLAPTLLAADDTGRILLDHIPGDDRYAADQAERAAIAADQHTVQRRAIGDADALVAAGVPDLRGPTLARWIRDRLAGHDTSVVADLLADLDARMDRVRACGLPDTLVHGDLHPGNVRGDGRSRTIIDWGDAFVGHPAFDILELTEGLDEIDTAPLVAAWAARWRAERPDSDPERAVDLLRPVAALRLAAVYAMFLANIEPSEHPYHRDDVPACLERAAGLA
ncbi:phosphotransferase family protein [Micromonospora auratinigra]|uniref:Ser/Thr protein kinase RdoA involved in Cpx stress response, MazF antagonist n=1 Tax=Micromonospora auratinigra TaxID=261654 RepID=A0A1A9A8E2_9ACTN|nr:aminoglycoside phosphotransferase family protein [Micromonospora auratinigra]SBT52435.1 Ser/Thr protein kinase RdoA involved in Cpx stress response, MazF antagonist [Micromonospora auratinigra]